MNTADFAGREGFSWCVSNPDPAVRLVLIGRSRQRTTARHQATSFGVKDSNRHCSFILASLAVSLSLKEIEGSWPFTEHKIHRHDVECSRWRRLEVVCPSKLHRFIFLFFCLLIICTLLLASLARGRFNLGQVSSFHTPSHPLLSPCHELPKICDPSLPLSPDTAVSCCSCGGPLHLRYRVQLLE